MSKEICISSTPHETRLAIVEDDQLTEVYYERENEYTLAGSIYKGRVTRVLPGMQSAFVDVGLERDAFLYVTDFLEEQEDSADFEQVKPGGAGSGQEQRRREPRSAPLTSEARPLATEARQAVTVEEASPEGENVPPGDEFEQGTRRWRGRRGRRRGFRARDGAPQGAPEHTAEPENPEPAAEGSSPAAEVRAVSEEARGSVRPRSESARRGTSTSPAMGSAPALVLPGESLSKYGQPAENESSAAGEVKAEAKGPAITSRPSTLIEQPLAWDGVSSLLPGESLSRYRSDRASTGLTVTAEPEFAGEGAESAAAGSAELEAHGTGWHAENEEHATSSELAEAVDMAFPPAQPENEQHTAAEHPDYEVESAARRAVAAEQEGAANSVNPSSAAGDADTARTAGEHDFEHVEAEFEPQEASASYRIDPAPSEFRWYAEADEQQAGDAGLATSEVAARPYTGEPANAVHAVEDAPENDFVETAPPTTLNLALDAPNPDMAPDRDTWGAPDDLWETGSTQSSAWSKTAEAPRLEAVPAQDPEPADSEESDGNPETGSVSSAGELNTFTPGDGFVEEEVIDDEEYDFAPIHAHDDEHDYQDLEEETLERAASAPEISEMIREAHIDRQVNIAGAAEEETEDELDEADDEEDDLEEQPAMAVEGAPAPTRHEPRTQDRGRGGRHRQGRNGRNGGSGGGHRRQSAQMTDLPIISELLKQGQEILVQIAKEPIAKKGARITSHIALPGRFLVFMPTVNHVGVSRKIWSDEERLRLKRILISEKGQNSGGFIVRTAADGASEEELRADLRFLISLWNEIKQRSDAAKAPALIYHDLNLVERILRDQVSDNFSTIWVDSETEYERIVRFLNRFQPQLVRRVKLYTKETPLFEQFGIQEEITKALKSKVWLKSGGSIVINQTEALVAIDINTGKYVGKTARLEDTILKTNLDAIPEIVRQIRLRDLGGIIVIDFIDMDERKNRHKVMQALEDALKADRAPSKVLQFNDFGLVAITRKRVKQSLERTLSTQCEVCAGTGMVKSPTTVCNEIYTEMRKMQKHLERHDVLLRVNPEVVKTLKANNGRWLNELEEMTGRTMIVKSDPTLHPEQFDIH